MFEKFTSVGTRDFSQRYLDTFGFFIHQGKKTLVKIIRVNESVQFVDKNQMVYTLKSQNTSDDTGFHFLPPHAGWKNTSMGAYLVKRRATRHWSRGISHRNTSITTPLGHEVLVDFPILEELYNSQQNNQHSLLNFLDGKEGTRMLAISPSFALGVGRLYCLDSRIGTYDLKLDPLPKVTVKLKDPELWGQEIHDSFKRFGLSMELNHGN